MTLIAEHIKSRLLQRKNYMGIACGEPGSGKSYAVLEIAREIDPSFTVDRIAFKPEEFIKIVSDPKLKSGCAVIFEEVGVGIPAREWYSISNKMVNYVFQTFRFKRFVCLFNTPSMLYIDSNTRILFNAYIEPVHIDFQREICTVKYMKMQYNPKDSKRRIYFHYLQKKDLEQIKQVQIRKPPDWLVEPYEKRKQDFANSLMTEALDEIVGLREKKNTNEYKKPNTECPYCGYRWNRKSKSKKITCSMCSKSWSIKNYEITLSN